MALLLIRTTDSCEYVHTDDPAVDAPEGAEGWIPRASTGANGEATTITIRPLNGFEQLESQSLSTGDKLGEQLPMIRAVLAKGLLAVDGDEAKAAEFIASPSAEHLLSVFTLIMEAGSAGPFPGPGSGS